MIIKCPECGTNNEITDNALSFACSNCNKIIENENYGEPIRNIEKRKTAVNYFCPNCGTLNTINEFALKNAAFMCRSCQEPFDIIRWKKQEISTARKVGAGMATGILAIIYIGIVVLAMIFLFVLL